jgi:hypothetical protein
MLAALSVPRVRAVAAVSRRWAMALGRSLGFIAVLALASGAALACGAANPAAESAAVTTGEIASAAPPPAACSSDEGPRAARRLSIREYHNVLRDLFGANEELQQVFTELAPELNQLPGDGEVGASFPEMDTRLSERHVATYLQVAEQAGHAVVSVDARLQALAGACALEPRWDNACFERFLNDFGSRVRRRPWPAQELQSWVQEAEAAWARGQGAARDSTVEARKLYQAAISRLLASPDFVLELERAELGPAAAPATVAGSAYELAARLALHFWQSMPDETLFAAAASGELLTEAGYRAEVQRLAQHQRGRATWYRFFREWLGLEGFGGFSLDAAFGKFVETVETTPVLYDDAVWEIEELVEHYTFETPGSLRDLLESDLVLTRSRRLAKLYGVPVWDGHSSAQSFPPGQRSGLLTRAALLISANHVTNPFERGAFVQRRFLCREIEPPNQRPPEAFTLPPFDPGASTRARYERKVAGGDCKGCHDLFSPFGYVLESYDALGRYRTNERLIDDDGGTHGRVPIDARARLRIDQKTLLDVAGPVELSRALASSATTRECFVRHYFRFTFEREETAKDQCTIDDMVRLLEEGGLAGLYRDVAFTSAFRGTAGRQGATL